jgi:hypothetical protein
MNMNEPKPFVVVRTYSAGVHVGTLEAREGKEVTLSDARRIWYWQGANSLHELALTGADLKRGTRISEPVASIVLTEAIEILDTTEAAAENLRISRWL